MAFFHLGGRRVTTLNGIDISYCQGAIDWAKTLSEALPARARVLEVAAGPGYVAIEIAKRSNFRVSVLDIRESFGPIAPDNARAERLAIDFQRGSTSQMPYADESFHFVMCRAVFKSFTDRLAALDEIYRVLVPGGRAQIYDLHRKAAPQQINAQVDNVRLSRGNTPMTKWTFNTVLPKNSCATDALKRLLAQSRFGCGELRRDGVGFDLRLERRA
jgi:ubiquinone/menaquinone biosynthesis C-methylase UbiE